MQEKIYAIASDIHGSATWCKKFIATAKSLGVQKFLLLGDLLYHGPRNDLPDGYDTKKVISMLSEIKNDVLCVRGNCDGEVDQMVLPFPILADYALFCYETGEKTRDVFLTHGHLFNESNPPLLKKGDVLFNGHFHVPCHRQTDGGAYYLNCGSVSLPKENSPHSFVLLKGDEFVWIDLSTGKPFDRFRPDAL